MKKWLIGAGAALLAGSPLALLVASGLVFAMLGGIMTAFSGGAGVIASKVANDQEEGDCTADGDGGTGTPTTGSQKEHVRTMIGIAKSMGISKKGQIVGVMVMLQESTIQNYANDGQNVNGYDIGQGTGQSTDWWLKTVKKSQEFEHDAVGNDADSVGLFQQRPSSGWGDGGGYKAASSDDHGEKAVKRLLDPKWASQSFFGGDGASPNDGLQDIAGWEDMTPTEAAQKVQVSKFPGAYSKWETKARSLVNENSDAPEVPLPGEGGDDSEEDGSDEDSGDDSGGDSNSTEYPMKEGTYTLTSDYGPRSSPTAGASSWHKGQDFGAPMGTPMYAAADGTVAEAGSASGFGQWVVIDHKLDGEKYSTVYGHMTADSIKVEKGDKVSMGDQIAGVGQEGYSTGPHLHFEVWKGGRLPNGSGKHINPMDWLKGKHTSGGGDDSTECGNAGGDEDTGGSASNGTAKDVIDAAKSQLGVDYSWGGGGLDGPSEGFGRGAGVEGFDCSGLTRYAIYQGTDKDYELPRTSTEQWKETKKNKVSWDKMEAGDLMFYGSGDSMHHVSIYLGDGKMVEAPRTGLKVRVTEARESGFAGATRPDYGDSE